MRDFASGRDNLLGCAGEKTNWHLQCYVRLQIQTASLKARLPTFARLLSRTRLSEPLSHSTVHKALCPNGSMLLMVPLCAAEPPVTCPVLRRNATEKATRSPTFNAFMRCSFCSKGLGGFGGFYPAFSGKGRSNRISSRSLFSGWMGFRRDDMRIVCDWRSRQCC